MSAAGKSYVWVDASEQRCCGEPFRTGDVLAWEANERPGAQRVVVRLGVDWAERIRFAQEHHGDDPQGVLTGPIVRIDAVACRREPHGRSLDLVVGSARLNEVHADVPWVPTDNTELWTHEGWVVELGAARLESQDGPVSRARWPVTFPAGQVGVRSRSHGRG